MQFVDDFLSFAVGIGGRQLGVEDELFGIAALAVGTAFERRVIA
jgi:hypothetical protein